jgi:GNAT superfamily N-acetyltransferase
VERLDPARPEAFFRLHSPENGAGWCRCVAWWVPTWEGWAERSAEENRRLREALFARGEADLWLCWLDGVPVASVQACPRDRLEKLRAQFALEPDPGAWAIGCFFVAPAGRGRGLARRLLAAVLAELRGLGATSVEAFPRREEGLDPGEQWTGPLALFRDAGFLPVQEGPRRALWRLIL